MKKVILGLLLALLLLTAGAGAYWYFERPVAPIEYFLEWKYEWLDVSAIIILPADRSTGFGVAIVVDPEYITDYFEGRGWAEALEVLQADINNLAKIYLFDDDNNRVAIRRVIFDWEGKLILSTDTYWAEKDTGEWVHVGTQPWFMIGIFPAPEDSITLLGRKLP